MADNTTLNTGTGGDVIATDDIAGVKYQIVKVSYGALDTATAVTPSTGLPTDPLDRATRDCGKVDIAMGQLAHDAVATSIDPVLIGGYASAAAPIAVSLDGDAVRSWYLLNGAQATVVTAAGALIGGDAANGLDVDVTRVTGTVTIAGTVTANAGTGTLAVSLAAAPVLVAGAAVIGKVGIDQTTPGTTNLVALAANQSVNAAQINGVTPLMGNGVTGTGSQRVTIASDNSPFSVNATPTPATSGGASIYHAVAAATTNTANVKASAGQVYGWSVFNNAAYNIYVKLHNTAGTPTAGASVAYTIGVPAGGGSNIDLGPGALAFGTGIGISAVKDLADAGTTVLVASDCVINLHYK